MDARELRIGNYVYYDDIVYKIETVDIEFLNLNSRNDDFENTYELDKVIPIPITEEWLDRWFDKNPNGEYYFYGDYESGGRYVFVKMQNAWTLFLNEIEDLSNCMELLTGFNYIHQLQNLYFALTGKELFIRKTD